MIRGILLSTLLTVPYVSNAGEIVHNFQSPAFSSAGGYSQHALTIHQLEQQRKQKIKDDLQAEKDRADRELKATNSYKFQNNLESRIYAQLSKQISDTMFGEGATVEDNQWYSAQTPFGDQVSWKRFDGQIFVEVKNSNGDIVAEFSVPIGEFAF
jgi:exonuclease VII large subunit